MTLVHQHTNFHCTTSLGTFMLLESFSRLTSMFWRVPLMTRELVASPVTCGVKLQALQLSLADLKDVFGVPLTEAAARLGVQRQDLVRSCRWAFSDLGPCWPENELWQGDVA